MSELGKRLISPHGFDGNGPVPDGVRDAAKRIAQLRTKFVSQWTPGMENPLLTREIEELFQAAALQAEWMRELYEARDTCKGALAIIATGSETGDPVMLARKVLGREGR